MITFLTVLKSGGIYDAEWVRKLRDAIARNAGEHRFACLSDVDVPCERIPHKHDWPGWWPKMELFRPGVVTGPTLFLDLDTIITGSLEWVKSIPYDFAMLRNLSCPMIPECDAKYPGMVGGGVMWFKEKAPHHVYEKFAKSPWHWMRYHKEKREFAYVGDQAFIYEAMNRKIDFITDVTKAIVSYKYHCVKELPKDASVVCFHGEPRPTEVKTEWMERAWA